MVFDLRVTPLTELERHRLLLYGRTGVSIVLFVASMIVGASTVLTAGTGPLVWVVGGLLIGSIVVLPRTTVPGNEKAREQADDEQLDHFRQLRRWLTWTRLAYFAVAVAVLVGLPELM